MPDNHIAAALRDACDNVAQRFGEANDDDREVLAAGIAAFLRAYSKAIKWPGDDLEHMAAEVEQEASRDA